MGTSSSNRIDQPRHGRARGDRRRAGGVWRRPGRGDPLDRRRDHPPGEPMAPAQIYDSNAQVLADAVRELGGEPLRLGITPDDPEAVRASCDEALERADVVLLSGGTSKGAGDVSYRVVAELATRHRRARRRAQAGQADLPRRDRRARPVVVLPGFPTSAIFTFHEFVAPVLRRWPAALRERATVVQARLAVKVNSEIGRTEYLLVGLVEAPTVRTGSQDSRSEPATGIASGSRRVSDGTGLRQRHDVQPRRRLRDDRPHEEIVQAGTIGRRAAARPRAAAGRSGGDRQPLHRPRLPARRVAAAAACAPSSSPSAARADSTPPSAASATSPASTCSIRRPTSTTGRFSRRPRADSRLRPPAGHRLSARATRGSRTHGGTRRSPARSPIPAA